MTEEEAFWAVHQGLPRQGPGEPADVAWAAGVAGLAPDARICDAGCGPGADFEALLAAAPEGDVTGVERHADFVEAAAARRLDRVVVRQGDAADITGPYDFIWAAGSLYFLGVTEGLRRWRDALAPGGAVAFSELCWLVRESAGGGADPLAALSADDGADRARGTDSGGGLPHARHSRSVGCGLGGLFWTDGASHRRAAQGRFLARLGRGGAGDRPLAQASPRLWLHPLGRSARHDARGLRRDRAARRPRPVPRRDGRAAADAPGAVSALRLQHRGRPAHPGSARSR